MTAQRPSQPREVKHWGKAIEWKRNCIRLKKKIIIKEGKTTELKKISTQRGNLSEWKKNHNPKGN